MVKVSKKSDKISGQWLIFIFLNLYVADFYSCVPGSNIVDIKIQFKLVWFLRFFNFGKIFLFKNEWKLVEKYM